jgi:magnesium transporter
MRLHSPKLLKRLKRHNTLKPPGTDPGTLIADPQALAPRVLAIGYGTRPGGAPLHEEIPNATIEQIKELRDRTAQVWVNVDGLADADLVRRIGELFGLHKLALEDVLSTHQRAKVDQFGDHLFIVLREPLPPNGADRIDPDRLDTSHFDTDQVSMFLGRNFLVSFQEKYGDCLGPVRDRIRQNRGKVASSGPDFLAYSIIDAIVDAYFPVLEYFGEMLEDLEDEAVSLPSRETVQKIHQTKRELLTIRRAIWPAREAINILVRDESHLIQPETRVYIRDVYDHMVQLIEVLENYRELGSDLMDIFLSSQSNKLNEVMKVLTVIATIFMPLSFLVGVWGMNFDPDKSPWNMPELRWRYGYPFAWAVILLTVVGMLFWYHRRGWIGKGKWKG